MLSTVANGSFTVHGDDGMRYALRKVTSSRFLHDEEWKYLFKTTSSSNPITLYSERAGSSAGIVPGVAEKL